MYFCSFGKGSLCVHINLRSMNSFLRTAIKICNPDVGDFAKKPHALPLNTIYM